jgi:6-phosphogluconolactonase
VDPSGKFAYVSNLKDFTVSMYTINSSTGILTPNTPAVVATASLPGAVAVDPSGKFAYVPNGGNDNVSMYAVDSGILTPNTPAYIAAGGNPFVVVVDPSGKFVYVTNANDNTVSIYTRNSDGTLTSAGTAATGNSPISIALTGTTQ